MGIIVRSPELAQIVHVQGGGERTFSSAVICSAALRHIEPKLLERFDEFAILEAKISLKRIRACIGIENDLVNVRKFAV